MGSADLRVAIVGAGIGGLCLGLALRERGMRAAVFEQASELTEIGAAVALSANATRELLRLGLGSRLDSVATIPTELIYRDGKDGHRIAAHPVRNGGHYLRRFGAPYYGVHRAQLQAVLGDALGTGDLHLGRRLVHLVEEADSVVLRFADGRVEHADLVVGADGVRSAVRRYITGCDDTVYSGTSAFRGIVPMAELPSLPDPEAIQFWMGPDAHLLHYAIGGGADSVNFFAVVEGPPSWPQEGSWTAAVGPDEAGAAFAGWHPAVLEMVTAVPHAVRWALFAVRPLTRWYRGRVVLIGDAAHGMLPHHGQGANTTIEDAFALAALLADAGPANLEAAFAAHQHLRRARTRTIQRSSWVTNDLLHLREAPAIAQRNEKVTRYPDDFGWIHDYDVRQALAGLAPPASGPLG
jgi:salicylate hydroxylase